MFKNLSTNRFFIGALALFVLCVVCGTLYLQHVKDQSARELAETPERVKALTGKQNQQNLAEVPAEDPSQGGHFHADGTWQEEVHEAPQKPAASASVPIPDGITDPEVLAAWQRLDYLAKHPFQWGGRPSARAAELMDELTPMWVSDDPHDHGEELMMTLDLLAAERDPRSAELLVTYQMDSGVVGRPIDEALVAMGPASVPALIARLNPEDAAEDLLSTPINLLLPIVEQHRAELGSIVDHIILPRLEAIAAGSGYIGNRSRARKALARLKK